MTPIDWETIWQQLDEAYSALGRKLKGRQAWVDVLFEHEFQDVHQAIKNYLMYAETPPKPAQILAETQKIFNSRVNIKKSDDDEAEVVVAPELVKQAWVTWWRHHHKMNPAVGGCKQLNSLPLEQAMKIIKKSAEKKGLTHLLPLEVQQVQI